MAEDIKLFIKVTEAQIEAVKENTRHLEKIASELESHSETLKKIDGHFTNGFKTDLVDQISTTEEKILEKVSSVANSFKVQWAIIGVGVVPIMYYFIKDVIR